MKQLKIIKYNFCKLNYDVSIIGGGIAGLSTAIRLK